MNRSQLCVANLRYHRPTASGSKSNRNLLGYLTYRDSRDQGVKMIDGIDRWTDHGMGKTVGEIAQRCEDLRSQHVLAFSLVINPNPQLVAMVPPEEREVFVRELTERVVEDFFTERGIDTGCEYSYVLHHRQSEDKQTPGLHNPHTHVVLPGSVWSEEHGERVALYFSRNKKVNHIDMLHDVTEQNTMQLLKHYVGLEWEQRIDALEAVRQRQQQVTEREPDGFHSSEEGEMIPFWGGARQVDEDSCAIGYYMPFTDHDGTRRIEFRSIATGLDPAYAEGLSRDVAAELANYPDHQQLKLYQDVVHNLLNDETQDITPSRSISGPSFDIDL